MYWWAIVVGFFLFGSPAAIYGIITQWFRHKEQMQDKRNEELRLQLQLEQADQERLGRQRYLLSSDPLPKEASWEDQVQTPYEIGYQQINQPQQ